MKIKKIAVIGATGSIGSSALEIFRSHPDKFKPVLLAAGSNVSKLAATINEFKPAHAAIFEQSKFSELKAAVSNPDIKLYAGEEGINEAINNCGAEMCLSSAVGSAGLKPTITAINAGMDIALANKESLVAGGDIILELIKEKGVKLLPVDSEHSALFQCLNGYNINTVRKLIITASGGAFRDYSAKELPQATPQQALSHPTWNMGAKITIDSATLANKALEVIEAHRLFGIDYDKIEVLVHRQSMIHGMVEFCDGTVMAQMATPDMRLPILHALSYPQRLESDIKGPSFTQLRELTFEKPDHNRFPMLQLGINAGLKGGLYPAVFSAANEKAVELFLGGKIRFTRITELVQKALQNTPNLAVTLQNILLAEEQAKNELCS